MSYRARAADRAFYAAEHRAFEPLGLTRERMDHAALKVFMDRTLDRPRCVARFGRPDVILHLRAGGRHSFGCRHECRVQLLPGHRSRVVLLHELAHCVSPVRGHGPEFASALLTLLEEGIGPEPADALRRELPESLLTLPRS